MNGTRAAQNGRSPRTRRILLPCVMLFSLSTAVYLPALENGFAYDDVAIITLDDRVRNLDASAILSGPYWRDTTSALYRPLTTLSYAVDWRLSNGSPAWFHLTNVLWHGLVTLLVFGTLLGLGGGTAASFAGSSLFAVHPVHVEAVANTVGRAELIAAALCLAAVLFWMRRRASRQRPATVLVLSLLFAGALAAKESAAVLPGLLVAVDVAQRRLRPGRTIAWLRRQRVPLAALGFTLILFLLVRGVILGAMIPADVDPSLEVLSSRYQRFLTALTAWPQYARLMFFPRTLLADYGPRIMMPATGPDAAVVAGATLLAATTLGALLAWERGHALTAAALLWFAVSILPVSNLIVPIGVLVAERTLYLPSVALSMGVLVLLRALRDRAVSTTPVLTVAALLIMALLAARTWSRSPDWRSTDEVFAALLRDRPDAFRGTWHMARVAAASAQPERALVLYDSALHLWPYRPRLIREAALYASREGRPGRAAQLSEFGLQRWPDDLILRRLLAGSLLDRGDTAAASHHIHEGLRRFPRDSLLLRMRAAMSAAGS